MARVLTFGSEQIDKDRYRFVLAAALNGSQVGDDGQQKRRSWEEQRADGKVLRALKAVSDEETHETPQGEVRVRVLQPEGGTVTLTGEQFEALKTWWKRLQWPTYDIDQIEDAYEWLMSAPEA
jgi:hypothetical protein